MYPVSRRSARLRLRELSVDDVAKVHAIYGSSEATEHLSFTPRSRQEVGWIIARSVASSFAKPRTEYALAVVENDSDDVVGFGRIATDPHQENAATFGFALRPDCWGVGYGVETVRLLLGLAFEELELHRVWGARSPLNQASARTMAFVGMVEEGVIRGHIQREGRWRDSVVHSMLQHEWSKEAG
ncbi:GNAT family N-acetyltransferase [Streptomyces qinglanensis]|uniref:GNAT family N-acetyltransferase n=1 Tax=Streptomyces qinglanensis TaxID=943816 RepID=UPI003D717CCD